MFPLGVVSGGVVVQVICAEQLVRQLQPSRDLRRVLFGFRRPESTVVGNQLLAKLGDPIGMVHTSPAHQWNCCDRQTIAEVGLWKAVDACGELVAKGPKPGGFFPPEAAGTHWLDATNPFSHLYLQVSIVESAGDNATDRFFDVKFCAGIMPYEDSGVHEAGPAKGRSAQAQ